MKPACKQSPTTTIRRIWLLLVALGMFGGAAATDSELLWWWLIWAVPLLLWKRMLMETVAAFALAYIWFIIVYFSVPVHIAVVVLITACLLVCFWLVGKTRRVGGWISAALGDSSVAPVPTETQARRKGREWGWFVLGFAVVACALTVLEIRQPFFFAQDDNFDYFLPVAMLGGRSLLSGAFCTYNPYQWCGSHVASVPQSILLYPPTYIAYIFSRYVLQSEYCTIDVFCILHLVAAYFITYWVARYHGMRAMLASAGSVAMTLSGYCLIGGRSWVTIPMMATLFPIVPALTTWLRRGAPARRWMVCTCLFVGWLIYTGYPQTWIYTMSFFAAALVILVWADELPLRRALLAVPAFVGGLGIAAPVWLPQFLEMMHFIGNRNVLLGWGIGKGILALIVPYPLVTAPHPNWWGNLRYELMGQFYYSGTFFYAVGFLLLAAVVSRRWSRQVLGHNVWLVCAGLAFVFALGDEGLLFPLVAKLPLFSKLTGPFKFLAYLNVLVFLGCGIVVERLLRRRSASRCLEATIGVAVICLMMYHCSLLLPAHYVFGDKPYPKMDPAMLRLLRGGTSGRPQRVISIAPQRSTAAEYVLALQTNFATVYRIPSFSGYDPCVQATPENCLVNDLFSRDQQGTLAAYGVKYLVAHKVCEAPVWSSNPVAQEMELPLEGALEWARANAIRKRTFGDVQVYELASADPLAFELSDVKRALPVEFRDYDVRVEVSGLRDIHDVVINVMWRPWLRVNADGRRLETRRDKWGRTIVSVPVGTLELKVDYAPPWAMSMLVGAALVVLAVGIARFATHEQADGPPK